MMRDCIGENEEAVQQRAVDAGKSAVKLLKKESRRRTGEYARDWASGLEVATRDQGVEVTVYNRDHYQLTHLLENDHDIYNQTGKLPGTVAGDRVIERIAERIGREFAQGGDGT